MVNNKSQVTIFVIAGLIVIAIIIIFFILSGSLEPSLEGEKPEINPNIFLENCIEDKVRDTTNLIGLQGGYVEPEFYRNFKFKEEALGEIAYLCYNQNFYLPCINQEALLIKHLDEEIEEEISEEVRYCFDELGKSLEKQGYTVNARYKGFDLELITRKIILNYDASLTLTKTGETTKHNNFRVIVPTRFYDIAIVAQEIVAQESRFCNFDAVGFMIFYPDFKVEKFRTGDSETIYKIIHRTSKEEFRFATRGCVIPPGIG